MRQGKGYFLNTYIYNGIDLMPFGRRTDHPVPQPPVRTRDSWWWQCLAFDFATRIKRCVLELGVGTGKTKTAIDVIQNATRGPVLVVAPSSEICGGWQKAVGEYVVDQSAYGVIRADDSIGTVARRAAKAGAAIGAFANPIVTVNYEAAWRMMPFLAIVPWAAIVYDESHKLKSPTGRTSKWALAMNRAHPHAHIICLTGTIMPHSPADAFGQIRAVDESMFGDGFMLFRVRYIQTLHDERREAFAALQDKTIGLERAKAAKRVIARTATMPRPMMAQVRGYKNLNNLADKLSRRVFHIGREVLNLEPPDDVTEYVTLPAEAMRVYKRLEHDLFVQVDKDNFVATPNVLTKILRLQQITSGFVAVEDGDGNAGTRWLHDAKKKALADIFERTLPGFDKPPEPFVVFARFSRATHATVNDLQAIEDASGEAFGPDSYRELSGARKEYEKFVAGEGHVFGLQLQAGSTGLDGLKDRCRYGVYYSTCWSLGDYDQSRGRLHRAGQERHVTFFHIIARGTVDEDLYRGYAEKRDPIEVVLTAIKERQNNAS